VLIIPCETNDKPVDGHTTVCDAWLVQPQIYGCLSSQKALPLGLYLYFSFR